VPLFLISAVRGHWLNDGKTSTKPMKLGPIHLRAVAVDRLSSEV
jgi:hypothetical protein